LLDNAAPYYLTN